MTKLQDKVFQQVLKDEGLPSPTPEHTFHPRQKWRFDYAFVPQKVAVEIEGGVLLTTKTGRSKGHAHPKRFFSDMEKYSEAGAMGWRVLRFTPNQACLRTTTDTIRRALGWECKEIRGGFNGMGS